MKRFKKDKQYYKFCAYGFLKNLRFFEPFLIIIFRYTGFSFLQIGILYSVKEIFTNVFEIPTGIIADSYGRRLSMIFSFIAYIVSLLIFYFFPYYKFYLAAMILFAIGEAFRTGTHKAMILEYLKLNNMKELKVYYYGSTRSCSQLGSALSSLIAAFIVFVNSNYRLIFLFTIIPYVMELFLMISYPKELDGDIKKVSGKTVLSGFWVKIKNTLYDFIGVVKNKEVIKTMFNASLFDAFFKTVKDYIQPVIKNTVLAGSMLAALSPDKRVAVLIGCVYFVLYLLTSFASRNSGAVVSKINSISKSMNITFLTGALFLALIGLFYVNKLYVVTVIVFVLYYMLQNIRRPIVVGFISDLIKSRVMATGLSVESQLKTLLIALMSPLLGFMADKLGLGTAIMVFGIIYLVSYLFTKVND